MKAKKCKQCKKSFTPERPLQYLCSFECSIEYLKKEKAKCWAKEKKVLKEKLMTHKDYLKLLQITFNTYIRTRDERQPCISCGTFKAEEFHAGHYVATTHQYLRFNENNVWKQCSKCNTHLRGNLIPYRIELINRIGLKQVEQLENDRNKEQKLSISEIKEMIIIYKQKIKDEKQSNLF